MKTLLIILFSTLFLLPNAYAEIAGVVLLAKGKTFATNMNGEQRTLKRRSRILEGDTLSTAANGKLQVRFVDKALLTLKANSKLDIRAYQLAKSDNQSEEVLMNLITGGFRTITGSIGKGEKSAYTVNTPAASIGIRGTNYEIAQESSGEFVIAVWDGGITVSNEQGSINVGSNSDFNFVRVKPDEEPEGLDEQPGALTDTNPTTSETQQEDKESSKEDGTGSEESSEENTETKEDEEPDDLASAATENDEAGETPDAAAASEGSAQESELEEEVAKAEETAASKTEEPFPEIEQVASPDVRFEDIEYSYLLQRPRAGLLVNTDGPTIDNVLIVQDETNPNALKVNLPGSQSGANNLDSFPLDMNHVNNSQVQTNVNGSEYVSWGKWNGTISLTDKLGGITTPDKNFYWLSAEAANLSSLRGEVKYAGSEGIGDINGTDIDNLSANFEVNFANGAIENGNLNFDNAAEAWNVNFNGSVTGVNATMDITGSNITGGSACADCVSGDIQGIFARPGDHFVGGFNLDSTSSSSANGLFSIKESP